ncbi:Bifunctional ligase/repressor BirA [Thalassocella blandensis]|nr:Bifunctional ligase/repressor BirA [Thalassocella blandensis]
MQINSTLMTLLHVMADGRYHSGETLGGILGISRAAVWKTLSSLKQVGVVVESVKGKGYCIPGGLSLLDQAVIQDAVPIERLQDVALIEVKTELDSTNSYLLQAYDTDAFTGAHICLAEMQTAGRGRRGRTWQSPFAKNIYMSLSWQFEQGIAAIEGLSLAVGVAIVSALQQSGVHGLSLKWPNDVLYQGKKLGGVLLEISGDVSGRCGVVVGLGLNVAMSSAEASQIDQPWIDLKTIAGESLPSRNALAASLIDHLVGLLKDFESRRFKAYREQWQQHAAYMGEPITLSMGARTQQGVLLGVEENGALRISTETGEQVFVGGEISMRPA